MKKSKNKFIRMKNTAFALFILFISISLNAQDNTFGIRFGDPTGFTYKRYNDGKNFEINFGRTSFFSGKGWYGNHFNKWYDNQNFNYTDYRYIGYSSSMPISIQFHYIIQKEIESVDGLSWYVGFGPQLRFRSYSYSYQYKIAGDPNWHTVNNERILDLDFGADFLCGIEYKIPDIPISVFADLNLFMEVYDSPFYFWGQGGIGGRYHF